MRVLSHPKSTLRRKAAKKTAAGSKKAFKFELTPEDIALDNAISAAAARSLAARRA
ncbi:MAG TPA: hypothetical protein VNU49_05275 [Opitutaceae bacterium]|jgi:hypothetical protein|nr:hypothetical protein [Opitutaceae bacterium]